jgi:hypothetical protein
MNRKIINSLISQIKDSDLRDAKQIIIQERMGEDVAELYDFLDDIPGRPIAVYYLNIARQQD